MPFVFLLTNMQLKRTTERATGNTSPHLITQIKCDYQYTGRQHLVYWGGMADGVQINLQLC